jgi:hypothetical protein
LAVLVVVLEVAVGRSAEAVGRSVGSVVGVSGVRQTFVAVVGATSWLEVSGASVVSGAFAWCRRRRAVSGFVVLLLPLARPVA